MDLPRLTLLKQIKIRISSDGGSFVYLGHDIATGRIFSLPRDVALTLRQMKSAALGHENARGKLTNEAVREAYKFLQTIETMRRKETTEHKAFNPIFTSINLFNVAPLQPRLYRFADWLVSFRFLVVLAFLLAVGVSLGARNDWLIADVFDNAFSISAILTFGLIAPFLKLIHEFGHVLAATKARVRVRQAGIYVIGLYPMPFVDCTEADISARKSDRITISVAGIVVDVTIGLLAMIAWHLVDGSFLRTLCGNIFVFSTLNSVLFNANPLIKLDGYYAISDAIGARNLYTRASKTLSQLVLFCMSLGKAGSRPYRFLHWGIVSYAVLTFVYRLNILYFIAISLVPKYLGIGAVVTLWGAYMMFVNPLLQDQVTKVEQPKDVKLRVWIMRGLLLGLIFAALFLVKLPFRTVVPVTLDVTERYQYTTRTHGYVATTKSKVHVKQGDKIFELSNQGLNDQLALANLDLSQSELQYETVRSEDPVKAAAAQEAIIKNEKQVQILMTEVEGLQLTAPEDGYFAHHDQPPHGTYLESGTSIGAFFPDAGRAQFTGPFDERYYLKYQDGPDMVTLRIDGEYTDIPLSMVTLRSVVTQDEESGKRAYTLKVIHDLPPSAVAGVPAMVRVKFRAEPLWRHALFTIQGVIANFREAQLLDRSKLLGG